MTNEELEKLAIKVLASHLVTAYVTEQTSFGVLQDTYYDFTETSKYEDLCRELAHAVLQYLGKEEE